jgi:hypothetical protein
MGDLAFNIDKENPRFLKRIDFSGNYLITMCFFILPKGPPFSYFNKLSKSDSSWWKIIKISLGHDQKLEFHMTQDQKTFFFQ